MLASPNYVQFVDSVNKNSVHFNKSYFFLFEKMNDIISKTSVANATITASTNIEKLLSGFFDQIGKNSFTFYRVSNRLSRIFFFNYCLLGVPHRPTQIDVPGNIFCFFSILSE